MSKTLNTELSEEEYWMLRMKKSQKGYQTWNEMIVDMCLEEGDDEPTDMVERLLENSCRIESKN